MDLPSRSKECHHLSQCSGYECPLIQSILQTQQHYYKSVHLRITKQQCALTKNGFSIPVNTHVEHGDAKWVYSVFPLYYKLLLHQMMHCSYIITTFNTFYCVYMFSVRVYSEHGKSVCCIFNSTYCKLMFSICIVIGSLAMIFDPPKK